MRHSASNSWSAVGCHKYRTKEISAQMFWARLERSASQVQDQVSTCWKFWTRNLFQQTTKKLSGKQIPNKQRMKKSTSYDRRCWVTAVSKSVHQSFKPTKAIAALGKATNAQKSQFFWRFLQTSQPGIRKKTATSVWIQYIVYLSS